LAWGTANAQPITFGFWCKVHRAGLYSGTITGGTPSRCYVFTFTQNAADAWEYKTVTIPGDVASLWAKDNTTGFSILFCMAAGTNIAGAPGAWGSTNYGGAIGTVNGVAATTDTFQMTGLIILPGLEAPSAARSPLIMRPYDQELVTCQRYFRQWGGVEAYEQVASGVCYGTTIAHYLIPLAPFMRSGPAFSSGGPFATSAAASNAVPLLTLTLSRAAPWYVTLAGTTASGLVAGNATFLMTNNDTTPRIKLDARL
jgi:hypothetical protein